MLLSEDKITEIFYDIDEFMIDYDRAIQSMTLGKAVTRRPSLSKAEIACIVVMFHLSGYRCFKHFYTRYLSIHLRHLFPDLVSYNRFVELSQSITVALALFAQTQRMRASGPLYFCDSTPLRVCHNKRIQRHKVFEGLAKRGKSTMGYFYGFKLHLICDAKGHLANFCITQANTDDRQPLKNGLADHLTGRIYGDKGYVGQALFETLYQKGLKLVTTARKNMKNRLLEIQDKIYQRKRSVIETINNQLKNLCQIEHSRHRSFHNFFNNLIAGIIA